jgi:hypothetical protein
MPAVPSWRVWVRRFLGLGWARIFLVLGVVFVLLALASPLWYYTLTLSGGDYVTSTYGWTTRTNMTYESGAWSETLIQSYNARGFFQHAIANSVGTSYLFLVALIIVLIAAIALFSMEWIQRLPGLGLLIIALAIVAFALLALFYPIVTVPPTAASDLGVPAITGYWGSGAAEGASASWGAALGWWFLLIGVVLGIVGGLWPYLQNLRAPMVREPPPREWQVER